MIYIIAEIGQAHDGSLGILHSYIDTVSKTGVDAIKFQTHIADAESSVYESFRTNFSYVDKTRIDYWRRMEFSLKQWVEIKQHCEQVGLEFISSPFSIAAIELLEKIGINRYKIGSGEVTNHLLLENIAQINKPVILSSGMANYKELDLAVEILKKHKTSYSILQCTSEYPTKPENWGLNIISELKQRYEVPVGFSDHSGDIYACIAASTLGAEILEFHVTFHKEIFGPDTKASIEIDKVSKLIMGIKQIQTSIDSIVNKYDNSNFSTLKNIFEKSLSVNRDLIKGHILLINDLETKKPKGMGIKSSNYKNVIGKKLKVNIKKWSFLKESDIEYD